MWKCNYLDSCWWLVSFPVGYVCVHECLSYIARVELFYNVFLWYHNNMCYLFPFHCCICLFGLPLCSHFHTLFVFNLQQAAVFCMTSVLHTIVRLNIKLKLKCQKFWSSSKNGCLACDIEIDKNSMRTMKYEYVCEYQYWISKFGNLYKFNKSEHSSIPTRYKVKKCIDIDFGESFQFRTMESHSNKIETEGQMQIERLKSN